MSPQRTLKSQAAHAAHLASQEILVISILNELTDMRTGDTALSCAESDERTLTKYPTPPLEFILWFIIRLNRFLSLHGLFTAVFKCQAHD